MGDAVVALDRVPADDFGFTLSLRDAAGGDRFVRLRQCGHLTLEQAAPVRTFRWSRGLGHFPGWWSVTTGHHVGYESWLERDHVRALDFDRDVVGIASQPFWLHWSDGRRKRRHTPDYFARLTDGSGAVIDVRADDAIEPKDAEAFAVTAQACEQVGWRYRRVGVLDPVLAENVRTE
ncbi:TnsA-like heteromeric transposase endonuclease subunit [Rhodococcus koreensis]|uniref:TnsA-like heteromeric transposase endonuclease subunit n=1 Tax=Rhodococcus koreensis TaxID=99653 RepID=UPI00367045F5